MTTPSLFQTVGISVKYHEPLVRGTAQLGEFNEEVNAYGHETLSVGGYWTASIGLTLRLPDAEDWFENGLGRQIKVYNQNGIRIWEGFVNQVTLNAGAISEVQGPLMDIGNRVSAQYAPMDYSVYPPVAGSQTTTIIVEDTNSQDLYGIIEKIVGAGQCTDAMAEQARDVFLEDNSLPGTTGQLSFSPGSAKQVQVTLDCLGNVAWLMVYIYENANPGLYTVYDKIIDILTADPNGWISVNTLNIEDNAFIVQESELNFRFAWDIMQELIALGNDVDDNRRIYGVYNDLVSYYSTMPTTIDYQHFLADPAQRVLDSANNLVYPWDVRPGKWLIVPDFLTGTAIPAGTPMRMDRRLKFIESVSYTAPWGLDVSGGKTDRLSQLISKLNYSGGML